MDERGKKREKGKGRDTSSCRTTVASSMLLQVGFEELHERRKDQHVCSGSPSPAFLLWVGNTTLPVGAGWQPARPWAGSRERAGRGCLHDTARLRDLAHPDLHATPTRSIWREEEQKALPVQGSPRCAQRHSCGGLNAVRVGAAPASYFPCSPRSLPQHAQEESWQTCHRALRSSLSPPDRSLFIIAAAAASAPSRHLCSSRAAPQWEHYPHVFSGSSPVLLLRACSISPCLEAADGS